LLHFLEPRFWPRTGTCSVFRRNRELACRFSRSNGVCRVLPSRPSDNTSRFRSQKNYPYRVDNERRGHASRNCHGSIEPKAADSAANPLRHSSGAVATDVDGGSDFEGWIIWAIKIHKHLHRDASFLSAQKGRVCQRFSFEPGGPTVAILPLRPLEAMVLRGNGPSGNQGQT